MYFTWIQICKKTQYIFMLIYGKYPTPAKDILWKDEALKADCGPFQKNIFTLNQTVQERRIDSLHVLGRRGQLPQSVCYYLEVQCCPRTYCLDEQGLEHWIVNGLMLHWVFHNELQNQSKTSWDCLLNFYNYLCPPVKASLMPRRRTPIIILFFLCCQHSVKIFYP